MIKTTYFQAGLVALALVTASSAYSATVAIQGYIGCHKLAYKVQAVDRQGSFEVKGPVDYLAIMEVYPDTHKPVEYRYLISAPGIGVTERIHKSTGFGPVTYFIKVTKKPLGTVRIRNLQPNKQPVFISKVWGISEDELQLLLKRDSFILMGLIPNSELDERDRWMQMLASKLASKPKYGIRTGFSTEIYYANRDSANVKQQIETCAKWTQEYGLPALIGLVSWWAGTPMHVPDGLGGKFGDVKYQQICYSPDVEVDEHPQLKELLGERYNRHYGLSVPNQWSSCPWLTMNSNVLNQYRYSRLDEAIGFLSETFGNSERRTYGIFLENEPRYWDTDCEAYNPKAGRQGKTLWADFNPVTVEAAKRDGVVLDPSDGLADDELSWLHRNVGRYNQETINAAKEALGKYSSDSQIPLYTHSLQLRSLFPGGLINHPASEWAYANGARTGIEGMWSQPSDFIRVREWGRWANLNREENDGQHIDCHLWDLRVTYMMGADLYNSYNWHAIGAERFFAYVNEFLENLPIVMLSPTEVKTANNALQMKLPMKLQAFSRIELPICVTTGPFEGVLRLTVNSPSGGIFYSEPVAVCESPGYHNVVFEFTTPAEARWNETAIAQLIASDTQGKPVSSKCIKLAITSAQQVKLSLDLRTQRALSLAVINRSER